MKRFNALARLTPYACNFSLYSLVMFFIAIYITNHLSVTKGIPKSR